MVLGLDKLDHMNSLLTSVIMTWCCVCIHTHYYQLYFVISTITLFMHSDRIIDTCEN